MFHLTLNFVLHTNVLLCSCFLDANILAIFCSRDLFRGLIILFSMFYDVPFCSQVYNYVFLPLERFVFLFPYI
jgi:hypothetical protein